MQKKVLFFSLLLFGLPVPIFGMEERSSQDDVNPLRNEEWKKEVNRFPLPTHTPPPSVLGFPQPSYPVLDGILRNLARGGSWEKVPDYHCRAVLRYVRGTEWEIFVLNAMRNSSRYKQMDAIIQQLEDEVPWEDIPEKDRDAIRGYAIEQKLSAVLDAIREREE